MKLRWYQEEAVAKIKAYWANGGGNQLIEAPTGSGKSAILGAVCQWVAGEHDGRAAVITHRKELIAQDAEAIRRVWPQADVGIYSAGLGKRQIRKITVGGVQSLYRKPAVLGHIDVLIIDEAHLVSPKSNGQYGKLIGALRDKNPHIRILGLSATPYRLGQGMLTQGKDRLFDSITYRIDVKRLIAEGFLSPMLPGRATAAIDLAGVRTSQGEYVAKDLELAADVDAITDAVVADLVGSKRQHCLVFGCGVEHAAHLRNAIRMAGVSCEMVTGSTPAGERSKFLKAYKDGSLRCLVNCDVLTTGFDAPQTDALFVVRATQSPSLWVQVVGRGMRIAPGKNDCLVFDYGGNTARHGPIDDIRIKTPHPSSDRNIPLKVCPSCYAEVFVSKRLCEHCSHEFPPPTKTRKANAEASSLDIISKQPQVIEIHERKICQYFSRRTEQKMLRVDYFDRKSIQPVASEFICLEHVGRARHMAERWWELHTRGMVTPVTVAEALEKLSFLREPRTIRVKQDGKYARVVAWGFEKEGMADDEEIPF
jgi:DNA repair protein RadD